MKDLYLTPESEKMMVPEPEKTYSQLDPETRIGKLSDAILAIMRLMEFKPENIPAAGSPSYNFSKAKCRISEKFLENPSFEMRDPKDPREIAKRVLGLLVEYPFLQTKDMRKDPKPGNVADQFARYVGEGWIRDTPGLYGINKIQGQLLRHAIISALTLTRETIESMWKKQLLEFGSPAVRQCVSEPTIGRAV